MIAPNGIKGVVTQTLTPLQRYKIATLFFCAAATILGLLIPFSVGMLIDGMDNPLEYTFRFAGIIGLVMIVVFLLEWIQNYMWFNLSFKASNLVKKRLHEMLLKKSVAFFKSTNIGDLTNKLLNDASSYAKIRATLMPMLLLNLIHIAAAFTFLVVMNLWLAAVCAALYVMYLGLYMKINSKLRVRSKQLTETFSVLQQRTHESIFNIDMVQMFCAIGFFSNRFNISSDRHQKNEAKLQLWKSLGQSATDMTLVVIPVVAVIMGIVFYHQGSISIGQIVAFYAFLPQLGEPFRNLTDFNISFQSAKGVEGRLEELLLTEAEQEVGKDSLEHISSVEFRKLNFAYEPSKIILQELSFTIKKGDSLGVIGESGTGKSTLIKLLLCRLNSENMLVNGEPVLRWKKDSFHKRIAVLPQEVFLFEGSICDNITMGRSGDIDLALSTAFAASIKGDALKLSGGEKQRIGLARALFSNIDMLVLDEPTSALDDATEKKIVENLQTFLNFTNIILVVVSHRREILKLCNAIITLRPGGEWEIKKQNIFNL